MVTKYRTTWLQNTKQHGYKIQNNTATKHKKHGWLQNRAAWLKPNRGTLL